MKKGLILSAVTALAVNASAVTVDDLMKEIEALKQQLTELKQNQEKSDKDFKRVKDDFTQVKAAQSGDNIKFGIDLRTSYDNIRYKTANGNKPSNNLFSNRLILTMAQQPTDSLIFKGSIAMNKTFGRNNTSNDGFNNYDWFSTVTPDDDILRVREAYFVYFGEIGEDVRYTASFGRRPSLNGTAGNLREDDVEASPLAHNINMQFDGASFNFLLDKVTDIPGFALKLCLGRGYSNHYEKYDTRGATYAKDAQDAQDMDMIGIIAKLYDNTKYSATLNLFHAKNLLGLKDPTNFNGGFESKGNMTGGALTFMVDGIGDDFFGFWAETKAFASVAYSRTNPHGNKDGMLGESGKKTGYSYYLGAQFPDLVTEDGRLGIEYNHGSKYWRSFTYGEDTLVGSKLAARGDAYEVYWTKPLLGDYVDMQLRYTYIDYDYTGSDMFFGGTGTPNAVDSNAAKAMDSVTKASNFRAYLRYRY